MDFTLDEGEQAVVDLAKQIFKHEVTQQRLSAVEGTDDRIDHALWQALAKAQLLGTALPEAVGGGQMGFFALCLLIEQAGRRTARIPLVPVLVGAAMPLAEFGTASQKALLGELLAGKAWITSALGELGDDVGVAPTTKADTDGRLTGMKLGVAVGAAASHVVVSATGPDGRAGLYLVASDAPGVSWESAEYTDLSIMHHLTLDKAPSEPLGDASAVAWTTQRSQAATCAEALGVSSEALIMTAKYTTERHQFGRPIGTFQAVQQRAGDSYVDVEAMRLTMWQAAWRLSQGINARREVHIAKYWAAQGGHNVTYAAQHLHGGMGFDRDYPLWRHFLVAKRCELELGSASAHLAALGRAHAQ